MNHERLVQLRQMWTTDADRYRILQSDDGSMRLVFDVVAGGPLLIEIGGELHDVLIRKMLDAGVEPISEAEAAEIGRRRNRGDGRPT